MRLQRLKKTLACAACCLGLALSVPLSHADDKPLQAVTYGGSTWLGHFPVWVGIEKGIYKAHGLDVRWESFGTSSSRMSAMVSGGLNFAGTSIISAMSLMAAGSKSFQIIGEPNSFATVQGVIGPRSADNLAALKNKKIGVTFASSGHVLILDLLKQQGLDADRDVMLINMPVAEMPAAIRAKQIDFAVAWTPTFNILKNLPDQHVIANDTAFSLYQKYQLGTGPDVLIASSKYIESNPKETQAFVDAYMESIAFIKQHPEESAKILTSLTKLPEAEQLAAVKEVQWHDLEQQRSLLLGDHKFQQGVDQLAGFMVENRQLTKKPNVADWFNTQFIQAK